VKGGGRTVQRWHQQWDGTPTSLQHKNGAGRPRTLSIRDVQQYIRAPILAANRQHRAVHYPPLHQSLLHQAGKNVSLRTVQRVGKQQAGVRQKTTRKRTADECE
jgi:hypothetical protein